MVKLFRNSDIEAFTPIMKLLGYKETKRSKTIFKDTSLVTYKVEKEVKNQSLLKGKYMPYSTIPFFFVILFAIFAIALATAFLIITITNKDADKLFYFFTLMLPTFLCTLIATGLSMCRYFLELKNIQRMADVTLLKKELEKYERD